MSKELVIWLTIAVYAVFILAVGLWGRRCLLYTSDAADE